MHFIELILYVLVSLLFLLLICFRVTLTLQTALKYILTGMLIGAVFVIPFHKIVDPYNSLLAPGNQQNNFWLHFSISVLTLFILLWPLRKQLFHEHLCQVQSVSDIFLLSFFTGMGFDLMGLITAHVSQNNILDRFTWIPPFQQELTHHGYVIAGTGYRIGLMALAAFLFVKYLKNKWAGIFFMLLAAALCSYEIAGLKMQAHDAPLSTYLDLIDKTKLIVWLPLLLTIGFNLLELQNSMRLRKISTQEGGQGQLFNALAAGNIKQSFQQYRLLRLNRQLSLIESAIKKNGSNPVLQEMYNRIQITSKEYEMPGKEQGVQKRVEPVFLNIPLLALFALLFILLFPGGINYYLCVALGIYIISKYLLTTKRPVPFRETSHIIAVIGDKSNAFIAVAAVFLALIGAIDNYFYPPGGVPFDLYMPFSPTFSQWTNDMFNYVQPTDTKKSPVYPDAFVIILATMTVGLINSRSWVQAPENKTRAPWKNYQLVRLIALFAVLFICHRFYLNGLKFLHEKYGAVLYYVGTQPASDTQKPDMLPSWLEGVHLMKSAPFGNNLAAWGMGLVVFIAGIIGLLVLKFLDRRFKQLTR